MEATLLTLGVILILVGLIGQVKAKEIEVGTKNPFVRVILGLIGFVFVSLALSGIVLPFISPPTLTPTLTVAPSESPSSTPALTTAPPPTTEIPPPTVATTVPPPTTIVPPTTLPPTTQSALSFAEDCLPFSIDSVRLSESNGNWWVVDGGAMLFFGTNQAEAQQSLDIIMHYRMHNQCFVGRPDPSLQYWLVNGTSPVGSYPAEDCVTFNPENIEVVNISDTWRIVEGNHSMLDFAGSEEEARQSYEILQYYGFSYFCFVGRPDPSMIYFRR